MVIHDLVARLVVVVATAWTLAGVLAVARSIRRKVPYAGSISSVSVLKPLCGADAELEANLESFFEQDHPDFELLFGVVDANDPALRVVDAVRARHPDRPCRVIVHAGLGALNPKIDNLLGLLPRAAHDLVLVSDSNVLAPRHYLTELATLHDREKPGLVTNLLVGGREDTLGAALSSLELSSFCAPGVALPTLLGDPLLVGKSALFSRSALAGVGGLDRLRDVLAEDFVLGKTFSRAGYDVVLAPTVVVNVTRGTTFASAVKRLLRWSMLRFRLRPFAFVLEPLTIPFAMLPVAWMVMGPWSVAWAIALTLLRDVGGWCLLRGPSKLWIPIALGPLRDVVALVVWGLAPFKRHVSWRGTRFRLGAGTLLYAEKSR
jgi:ceramide glucosyltransferase